MDVAGIKMAKAIEIETGKKMKLTVQGTTQTVEESVEMPGRR